MKPILFSLIALFLLSGCSSQDNTTTDNNNNNNIPSTSSDWSIPVDEVFDGGPGKDGIPSIDNPNFIAGTSSKVASYMSDDDLIIGLKIGNTIKAYPHRILDWHEIVNDVIDNEKISINYCPLTGTAFAWKGNFNTLNTTFGVSGLLYNTNLILYDRQTDSYWSQLKLESVKGKNKGQKASLIAIYETTWGLWKSMYPTTQILSNQQQVTRDYDTYPYGPYKVENDFFLFPVKPLNKDLPGKERVFAILEDSSAKIYRFNKFGNGTILKFQNYIVVGNQQLITAYELPNDMLSVGFSFLLNNQSQTLFSDNDGNKWSIDGIALEGPRKGQKLKQATSVTSYWFAIAAFYDPSFVK